MATHDVIVQISARMQIVVSFVRYVSTVVALPSGASDRKIVQVQFLLFAPQKWQYLEVIERYCYFCAFLRYRN